MYAFNLADGKSRCFSQDHGGSLDIVCCDVWADEHQLEWWYMTRSSCVLATVD